MKPVIVLVNSQMGENIGASARAMLNCGIEELRLVAPRDGWPSEQASIMSSGALDKMPDVKVYGTTAEAVADCHQVYATTARPRDMLKPMMTAREAAGDIHARSDGGQRSACLFGAERSGLSNEDVALAHTIITIPVNPDFSSLNLAQGVLLCAYEWFQHGHVNGKNNPSALQHGGRVAVTPEMIPAPHGEFDNLCRRLEEELQSGGFFKTPEMRPTVMRNLKAMLSRGQMTSQEVNTFHGIITVLAGKNPQ